MRLHQALELMEANEFHGLKYWRPEEAAKIKDEVLQYAPDAAEFSLLNEMDSGQGLDTFQQFGFELWSAGLAKAPYSSFWISWSELTQGPGNPASSLGAMCVHLPAENQNETDGIGIYVMGFIPRSRSGFSSDRLLFCNRLTPMWLGVLSTRIRATDNTPVGTESVRSGFRAVAAVIGALGTPKASRAFEPAPDKLNRQRILRGRPAIRSRIVIDLRTEKNFPGAARSASGGWTVKPHWRRGHVRTLSDGRRVPIPPCCVNMVEGIPVKPEYVLDLA